MLKKIADKKFKSLVGCSVCFLHFDTERKRLSTHSDTISVFTAFKMVVYFPIIFIMSPIPSLCLFLFTCGWVCVYVAENIP